MYTVSRLVTLRPCKISRPTPLARTYGLDRFRQWVFYGRRIFLHSFVSFARSASPCTADASDSTDGCLRVITPRDSCGAVYCNRSCLFVCVCVGEWVCVFVGGSVTTITRNCVCIDRHQTGFVGL